MVELYQAILCIGALIIGGLLCSFLIILNIHKEEIWESIKSRYFNEKND